MEFTPLFSQSYDEFKANWREYAKIITLAFGLPLLIGTIIFAFILGTTNLYSDILAFTANSGVEPTMAQVLTFVKEVLLYATPTLVFALAAYILLLFLVTAGLIVVAFKKKTTAQEIFAQGKKYFWKYTGLVCYMLVPALIVAAIFALSIYLLVMGSQDRSVSLVTSGGIGIVISLLATVYLVYLYVGWILAPYIMLNENKGIKVSLHESRIRTKGNRWLVLGYMILFMLIVTLIEIVIGLAKSALSSILLMANGHAFTDFMSETFIPSLSYIISSSFLEVIITVVTQIATLPLTILFVKNLYLAFKPKKV